MPKLDFNGFIHMPRSTKFAEFSHATAFQSVRIIYLREILKHSFKLNPNLRSFLDLGSGKGKACIFAHQSELFRSIIGIEISESLLQISINNAKFMHVDQIRFLHRSANTYRIAKSSTLIFLYNPFDEVVLDSFLKTNLISIRETGSLVGYVNHVYADVLEKHGLRCAYLSNRNPSSIWTLRD